MERVAGASWERREEGCQGRGSSMSKAGGDRGGQLGEARDGRVPIPQGWCSSLLLLLPRPPEQSLADPGVRCQRQFRGVNYAPGPKAGL